MEKFYGGTQKELDELSDLLRNTEIEFQIRNQDGTLSKVKLQGAGWKATRNLMLGSRTLLDEDYKIEFYLERKGK